MRLSGQAPQRRLPLVLLAFFVLLCTIVQPVAALTPFLVPGFFSYGFLGTVFTHNALFGLAIPSVIWAVGSSWARHRADDFAADPTGALYGSVWVYPYIMIITGVATGIAAVGLLKLPQLLEIEIIYPDVKRGPIWSRFSFWGFALVVASILGLLAVYLIGGFWDFQGALDPGPVFDPSTMLAIGIVFAVISVSLIISVFVIAFLSSGRKPAVGQNIPPYVQIKYFLLLVVILLPTAIFIDTPSKFPPPNNVIIGLSVLLAVWIGAYFWVRYTWPSTDRQIVGTGEALWWTLIVGSTMFFTYTLALVFEQVVTPPTIAPQEDAAISATVAAAIAFVLIYILLYYCVVRPRECAKNQLPSREEVDDDVSPTGANPGGTSSAVSKRFQGSLLADLTGAPMQTVQRIISELLGRDVYNENDATSYLFDSLLSDDGGDGEKETERGDSGLK